MFMNSIIKQRKYKLIDSNGVEYLSNTLGTLGGNRKLKIYGRLDCSSANRWIKKDIIYKIEFF